MLDIQRPAWLKVVWHTKACLAIIEKNSIKPDVDFAEGYPDQYPLKTALFTELKKRIPEKKRTFERTILIKGAQTIVKTEIQKHC